MTKLFSTGETVFGQSVMKTMTIEDLWQKIRNDPNLRAEINHLRKIKRLDSNAYGRMKVKLPFFCCSLFHDGIRNGKNFLEVSSFVVDIDKYSGEAEKLSALRERISMDDRVALCFVSPGGDGMKVVFALAETCRNLKQFSDFYKSFVNLWAQEMDLSRYVDFSTCDATRACFLSTDDTAYINPMAQPIAMEGYLPNLVVELAEGKETTAEVVDLGKPADGVIGLNCKPQVAFKEQPIENCSHNIQPEVYAHILASLKSKSRPNPLQQVVKVPEPLVRLMPVLEQMLLKNDIHIIEVRDVQSAKQIQMQCADDFAEINIYYGKRGFSVVKTTKRGTHPGLCELCAHLAEQAICSRFSEAYQIPDPLLN